MGKLIEFCENGDFEMVKKYWESGVEDLHRYLDICFEKSHFEIGMWVWNKCKSEGHEFDPRIYINDHYFEIAVSNGDVECVKWMLELVDLKPTFSRYIAFRVKSINALEFLYEIADLHADDNEFFRYACRFNNLLAAKWAWSKGNVDLRVKEDYAFRMSYARYTPGSMSELIMWLLSLYEDTSCLVQHLTTNITTIPLYKKGGIIVAMGKVISPGKFTIQEANDIYLEDTKHLRNYKKKPLR